MAPDVSELKLRETKMLNSFQLLILLPQVSLGVITLIIVILQSPRPGRYWLLGFLLSSVSAQLLILFLHLALGTEGFVSSDSIRRPDDLAVFILNASNSFGWCFMMLYVVVAARHANHSVNTPLQTPEILARQRLNSREQVAANSKPASVGTSILDGVIPDLTGDVRIGRKTYFVAVLVLFALVWFSLMLLGTASGKTRHYGEELTVVTATRFLCILLFHSLLAVPAYFRLKDIRSDPKLSLLSLIPGINLWVGVRCLILPARYAETGEMDSQGRIAGFVLLGLFLSFAVSVLIGRMLQQ